MTTLEKPKYLALIYYKLYDIDSVVKVLHYYTTNLISRNDEIKIIDKEGGSYNVNEFMECIEDVEKLKQWLEKYIGRTSSIFIEKLSSSLIISIQYLDAIWYLDVNNILCKEEKLSEEFVNNLDVKPLYYYYCVY